MNYRQLTVAITIMASPGIGACLDDGSGEAAESPAALDACPWAPTVTVTPATIPPMAVGVPVVFDVAVTNPNAAPCEPLSYVFSPADTGLILDPPPLAGILTGPPAIRTLESGATAHIVLTATASASADGGDTFEVIATLLRPLPAPPPPSPPPPPLPPVTSAPVHFTVASTPGCQVSTSHELMIRDLSVVDDPVRTAFDPTSHDPRNGVWTFKHLVESMARTPTDAPAMVEAMLTSFTVPVTVNGFTVAARPGVQSQILAKWPRTASGALDLARAPLRLLAIVNRLDLRDLAKGDAGEGRFVFAFDLPPVPGAPPPEATIIFEYKLPALSEHGVVKWANAFHALGSLPFGESYNAALQAITQRFVRRGARPWAPNGSAINAVRTNEIPFGDPPIWELREFHLSWISGRLEPAALELTPDLGFDGSTTLAAYIHANQSKIIAGTHSVPKVFAGQRFQAGAVLNELRAWTAPGANNEARHHFSINTCNGCHAGEETGTVFLHLSPRGPGLQAPRSRWLTGTVVADPVTGERRTFDDLGRRKADLEAIVCRDEAALSTGHLRKGISRVH